MSGNSGRSGGRRRVMQTLAAAAAVGLVAWGLGAIYWPLAPIAIGGALLVEVLTCRERE